MGFVSLSFIIRPVAVPHAPVYLQDFIRIRAGIGRPVALEGFTGDKEAGVMAYVLSDFTPEEKKTITQTIPQVSEAIICILSEGLATAMNKYN